MTRAVLQSALPVAGRLAMPGQSIDHGLDEGQLNRLGIGRCRSVPHREP